MGPRKRPRSPWAKDLSNKPPDRRVRQELRVPYRDLDNHPLSYGQEGEIVVKGPKAFVGYKNQDLNKDSFDEEGWFHTGDIGRLNADGYMEITGRKKDIIIRGGKTSA